MNPYCLGYLLGDGWLTTNVASVGFASTDRQIIDDINVILKWTGEVCVCPPTTPTRKTQYRIQNYDPENWEHCRSLGVPLDKSHTHDWIVEIPQSDPWAFLRGYLDSDGTFTLEKNWALVLNWLSSSPLMLEAIKSFLRKEGVLVGNPSIVSHGSIFKLAVRKQTAIPCLERLYPDGEICLWRKRDKARSILQCLKQRK